MVLTGSFTDGSTTYYQRVIGGSLQYGSGGFMPVIVISRDYAVASGYSDTYVLYDTSVIASTALYYSIDALAVNRNGNKQVIGLGQPRDSDYKVKAGIHLMFVINL